MRKYRIILSLAAVMAVTGAAAQEAAAGIWSLKQCIDYAIAHNISIQQSELEEENSRISLQTTRYSRLPNLNASLGQGFGFGRSTGRDGSTVDRTSASTNFSISTSVPLFTGFRIPNQVKAEEFNLKAATASLEQARQDLGILVATQYLQTLYYKGLERIAEKQVKQRRQQLEMAVSLVEVGKKPVSERAEAEAQLASAEYSLSQAQGNATLAHLNLTQLLNLENPAGFEIVEPDTSGILTGDMPQPDLVFEQAVDRHPSILTAQYHLESSRYSLKVARSYLWPGLNLSGSYSNSYYHVYDQENIGFSRQLDLNGSEYIGLSLNIPIFNRFSTRNSIRQARLAIRNRQLSLDNARQKLFKEIQQAFYNALTARSNFASATKAADATEIAYRHESERYAAGRSTSYDLLSASTTYEKAQQDALQAKYEYLIRMKILEYYNGVPIE